MANQDTGMKGMNPITGSLLVGALGAAAAIYLSKDTNRRKVKDMISDYKGKITNGNGNGKLKEKTNRRSEPIDIIS